MSDTDGYNGWKNYPTWAVHLWLTNDQASEEWALDIARGYLGAVVPRWAIGDALKESVREQIECGIDAEQAWMGADLLGWALDNVDWYEVADAFIEMCEEIPA